ncbi:MAG: polynucleotide adenylyltransferase, partial [Chloroflexi bacterium]|nr:polynucleotide adenylyltransferase [Chloroflexota bacterium]
MNDAQRAIIQRVAAFLATHDAEAYLVGGPVRDMLLGRPPHDLDFVITRGDSLALARALADELDEPFVLLDERFGTGRVVIRHPAPSTNLPIYLDLNRLRAPTLREDLADRDFTVNAIAAALQWADDPAPAHLVDPFGGQRDLDRRLIRAVSAPAFRHDPLRMLRA